MTSELKNGLASRLIVTDEKKVTQILTNLVSNAIKFSPNCTVHIKAETTTQNSQEFLKVSVVDTGVGISKEHQAGLFQPFTQADDLVSRRFGGSGLGLSISKKYAELMSGHIDCQSDENKGSQFWFIVPLAESSTASSSQSS